MDNRPMTAQAAELSIVTLPVEIDAINAGTVHAQLVAACTPTASIVVADLSDTVFCDSSAVRALVQAHRLAVSRDIDFRLVVTSNAVFRVLELSGLETILRLYPSIESAVGDGVATGAA